MGPESEMKSAGGEGAVGGAAPAMPRSLEDLHELLQMYNRVTQRLQVSHERLEGEVVRLREQLEEKNRELEQKKRLAALGEMAAKAAPVAYRPNFCSAWAGMVAQAVMSVTAFPGII